MDISFLSKQRTLSTRSDTSSPAALLERGLQCVHQGYYSEALCFFTLARDVLSSNQIQMRAIIDAFVESHTNYWQAQEALHLASKRFVEAEREHQAYVFDIEKLLLILQDEGDSSVQKLPIATLPLDNQDGRVLQATEQLPAKDSDALPELYITCFGRFEVWRFEQKVDLCANRSGQAILRYLIAQPGYRASRDTLMDVLWREDGPEVARRKLQIAVSALRRSLNNGYISDAGGGYILCQNQIYQLNPAVHIRTDVDELITLFQAARQASGSEAAVFYEKACKLYTGLFLVEDRYADWSFVRREQLSQLYVTMCRALANCYLETASYAQVVQWASVVLRENRCDEEAHRLLMRAYIAEGRRSEAVRQYRQCEHMLAEELGVSPMPETTNIFRALLVQDTSSAEDRAKIERE